jgi:hypothetical protein
MVSVEHLKNFVSFFGGMAPGFELRALCLLGMYSITFIILSDHFALAVFQIRFGFSLETIIRPRLPPT